MKDAVIGVVGLTLVGFSLFGGVDGGMAIAAGVIGLILCFLTAA